MWRCFNCGYRFNEPQFMEYYAEDYYGVGSMFPDKHTITIRECPHCGSDDIEEQDEIRKTHPKARLSHTIRVRLRGEKLKEVFK